MYIKIQINDSTYASLLNGTGRIKGSIGLISPTEGNFNAYSCQQPRLNTRYIRLPHGRVSVNKENVRLTLHIGLEESNVLPAQVILSESELASDFVDANI